MKIKARERYTRKNPNGSFRVPIEEVGQFRIEQNRNSIGIFGDVVDKLGEYEELLSIQEAREYAKKKKK